MKEQVKIGDIVEIKPELEMYHLCVTRKAQVIAIYPKKWYNMYLCKYVDSNMKVCITDQDIACTHTVKNLSKI